MPTEVRSSDVYTVPTELCLVHWVVFPVGECCPDCELAVRMALTDKVGESVPA